jgi:hypothetical protein
LKQNRCNQGIRTKVIAKRMDTFPFRTRFLASAIPSTDDVAKARVTLPQSGRVAGLDCLQHRSDSMVKCTTLATSAGNLTGVKKNSITPGAHGGSTLLEKVIKTIGKIATAFAVAFSAFALTATPGSAQNVAPAIIAPGHYCLSYDGGGSDCSFTSYAQCEATASGQDAECYGNTPQTMKTLGALVLSKDHPFD